MNSNNTEDNESKILIDKKDHKMIRLKKNFYLFEYEIDNEKILLDKIVNLDLIKLIYEINKDVFDGFYLDINSDKTGATAFFLFKHFFQDFGMSQKYSHLDVSIEKSESESKIIYRTKTNDTLPNNIEPESKKELIPITNIVVVCDLITPHKMRIQISTTFHKKFELPEFIEKMSTNIISKIFLRIKQFIEKI
jgi:hypothetical protein